MPAALHWLDNATGMHHIDMIFISQPGEATGTADVIIHTQLALVQHGVVVVHLPHHQDFVRSLGNIKGISIMQGNIKSFALHRLNIPDMDHQPACRLGLFHLFQHLFCRCNRALALGHQFGVGQVGRLALQTGYLRFNLTGHLGQFLLLCFPNRSTGKYSSFQISFICKPASPL